MRSGVRIPQQHGAPQHPALPGENNGVRPQCPKTQIMDSVLLVYNPFNYLQA